MENNELKVIQSKILKNISIWVSQSYILSLVFVVIFLVFGFPFIEYLQNIVRKFPYIAFFSNLFAFFQHTFKIEHYVIFFGFVIVFIAFYLMRKQLMNNRLIIDNFTKGLNAWAIPLESSWTTQNCLDKLGKMLIVTNSIYPGTLKGAYWWYDYDVSFEAKIDADCPKNIQNFAIVIRSESNLNGIMLQITTTQLRPHFIYRGTFILDNDAFQQLPTTLLANEWIKSRVVVSGNDVDIYINDYKLQYKIPTKVFNVADEIMSKGTISLKEIYDSDREINDKRSKVMDIFSMSSSVAKDEAMKTIEPLLNSIPRHNKIILEYQNGSVGFRESGREKVCFRNFKIKKL